MIFVDINVLQNCGNLVDAAVLAAAAAIQDARIPQLDVFEVAGDTFDFEVEHEKPSQLLTKLVGTDLPVRFGLLRFCSNATMSLPVCRRLRLLACWLAEFYCCWDDWTCVSAPKVCATVHRIDDSEVFDLTLHEEACSSTCLAIAVRTSQQGVHCPAPPVTTLSSRSHSVARRVSACQTTRDGSVCSTSTLFGTSLPKEALLKMLQSGARKCADLHAVLSSSLSAHTN